jgi:ABC-type Mn2+/Zn2+ transport system ATPase subunit
MTFRTFFLLIFLLSISLCFAFTFNPNEIENVIAYVNRNHELKSSFLGLVSLIVAIFSYLGLVFSHYYANKREKSKDIKKEAERINLEKIHAELKAMC